MTDLDEVQKWVTRRLSMILDYPPDQIEATANFDELGLDSITRASLAAEIATEFNCSIDMEAMLDCPTVAQLAEYVVAVIGGLHHQQ